MNNAASVCPCHPGEARDTRMAFLDTLIRAGWGSVPMYLIDSAIEKNGGVLPPCPTLLYDAASESLSDGRHHAG